MDFSIDLNKVAAIGSLHPFSIHALEAYEAHNLSSEDRLYYQLLSDLSLMTRAFMPGTQLCELGEPVTNAYVVRQGEVDVRSEGKAYRVGPGAVLGLAAGLAHMPHNMTASAITVVSASVIPIDKALKSIAGGHPGLRGINRSTVMRILGLSAIPESLK